ncbi:MAG: hypothetical protein ABR510_11225 [Trueperaceae bacterium]
MPFLILLGAATALALAACGPSGLSDDEVGEIRNQLETVEQRLDEVHALLVNVQADLDEDAVEVIDEAQRGLDESIGTLSDVLGEIEPPPPPPPPAADPVPGVAPDPNVPDF